jgi:type I restriction enzyme R subunit
LVVDAALGDAAIGDGERKQLVDMTVEVVDTIVAELTPTNFLASKPPASTGRTEYPHF